MIDLDPLALLTVDEVAALWQRGRKVVLRLVREGRLHPVGLGDAETTPNGKQRRPG
jgi:hypothetical protein